MLALCRSPLLYAALAMFAMAAARAELQDLHADGWHAWDVAAIDSASQLCCFAWPGYASDRCGCDLDGRRDADGVNEIADDAGGLTIYVRMEGGQVRDIRPLSAGCPVTSEADILDIDPVSASESIEWLSRQVHSGSRLADDAIIAISFHADGGVDRLIRFVEDRSIDKALRETTLFWLANSGSDRAFAYLDDLLMR